MSVSDTTDLFRLSSGPIGKEASSFLNGNHSLNVDDDNDDDDDGPPAIQMSSEELAALQSRFRLECDTNSDSEDSDEDSRPPPTEGPSIHLNGKPDEGRLTTLKSTTPNGFGNAFTQDESCGLIPTDSMILENKTIYENMLNEDPANQTSVESWQAINRPKYISRPEGWNLARPNDLVQITPDEYLSLRSEPVGALGDTKDVSAFEMAGLLPSTSPASSLSSCTPEAEEAKTLPSANAQIAAKTTQDTTTNNESVNIDYLLQPSDPVAADTTLDGTATTNALPLSPAAILTTTGASQNKPNEKQIPANIAIDHTSRQMEEEEAEEGKGKHTPEELAETPSYRSNSGTGSISFSFNNGSALGDATDPDLAAVDAMLEMYDADVDPDELAEHIMMRFGVNPQRPASTSAIFRDQDESLLRPSSGGHGGGLSMASVVSSTPKAPPSQKSTTSRPASVQSNSQQRTSDSTTTQENISVASRRSNESLPRPVSSNSMASEDKRISMQSDSSAATLTNGFTKPEKPAVAKPDMENRNTAAKTNDGSNNVSQGNLSLLSSFDGSAVSEYSPALTPMVEKGPFIRLEWDKLAVDMKEPVFIGQSHDITLTAKNSGRLWVQITATLQNAKVNGTPIAGLGSGLHVLNSTVVIEPNSNGSFRFRFTPDYAGFYSTNIEFFAFIVGSVVEESRQLPPIPFSADVRLPTVEFLFRSSQPPDSQTTLCDFGALPTGASRRMVSSLHFSAPATLTPESATFGLDVPVVITIRPESAWRCFHFLPLSASTADVLKSTKPITAGPAPLIGAGHATKLFLSAIHQQHDFIVCFTARYDTELPQLQQGLDINEAEIVAQTDTTPPIQLATALLRASVGTVALKAVGLDENADETTTLRINCQLTGSLAATTRSFCLLNSGSIAVDISTSISCSQQPDARLPSPASSSSPETPPKMFTVQPSQFTLLPKQKMQITVRFEPFNLAPGEMCAGFLSFFTDPPQSGSPGQLPALDVSLIGIVSAPPSFEHSDIQQLNRAPTLSVPSSSSCHSTPGSLSASASLSYDGSAQKSMAPSDMTPQNRRTLVTSHQRVVWWGVEAGQSIEQVVNLRNVGFDEVSVRITIRDQSSEISPAFVLSGNSSSAAPLLATLPGSSDFPMRIVFKAQCQHLHKAAVAKLQIKVLTSGTGSVPPGVKFCIPLFGAVGTAALNADGASLRTTSAGHYYAIIGTVPTGCRRSMRLSLRNTGQRSAFFSALPFADMSCTQRLGPNKLVCTPPQAYIPSGESIDISVDLYIGDREAALCAERSYIVACLQMIYGDNDLRVLASRALSAVKSSEARRILDETARELLNGSGTEQFNLPRTLSGNLAVAESWPEHVRLFARHCRRLYVALVGERTAAGQEMGANDFDENETLQHTMLLDDTQATIMMPAERQNDSSMSLSLKNLVEQKSATKAPALATIDHIRLLPSELLLTAVSDSRTLMLINDSMTSVDFEAEWAAHVLAVEPPRGTLPSNGTATVHVRLAAGGAAYVENSAQGQWVGRVGVRTSSGSRLESVVRVHLTSSGSGAQVPAASQPAQLQRYGSGHRQVQKEPVAQIVFGSRDCPHPPAARLDFGKIPAFNDQQKKVTLRLENEQPFPVNWTLEELSAYALASLPGSANSGSTNGSRCVPSIFSFLPSKNGSLPANGGQALLRCVFQPPFSQKHTLQDTNYLQHFLLSVRGTTGWMAETRISVVASVVTENGSTTTMPVINLADQSHTSRFSNSSTISAAPLSASHSRRLGGPQRSSRWLVCPGEKHEFKKSIRPGETLKEKVNLENRSSTKQLHVEVFSGPALPFTTKHRRFTIEPMHYLHLPVVFKPSAPGSYRSEMILHASTSLGDSTIPDEVVTISLIAQSRI